MMHAKNILNWTWPGLSRSCCCHYYCPTRESWGGSGAYSIYRTWPGALKHCYKCRTIPAPELSIILVEAFLAYHSPASPSAQSTSFCPQQVFILSIPTNQLLGRKSLSQRLISGESILWLSSICPHSCANMQFSHKWRGDTSMSDD